MIFINGAILWPLYFIPDTADNEGDEESHAEYKATEEQRGDEPILWLLYFMPDTADNEGDKESHAS